jgi:hypothetical protein
MYFLLVSSYLYIWKFLQNFRNHLFNLDTYRVPCTQRCKRSFTILRCYLWIFHSQYHKDGHKKYYLYVCYDSIPLRNKYILFICKNKQENQILERNLSKIFICSPHIKQIGENLGVLNKTMKVTWIFPYASTTSLMSHSQQG